MPHASPGLGLQPTLSALLLSVDAAHEIYDKTFMRAMERDIEEDDCISRVIVGVLSTWTMLAMIDFHKHMLPAWCACSSRRHGVVEPPEHEVSLSRAAESPCTCATCVTHVPVARSSFRVTNRDRLVS